MCFFISSLSYSFSLYSVNNVELLTFYKYKILDNQKLNKYK